MNLQMVVPATLSNYKSRSQMARVVTEAWGLQNLYCASCERDRLNPARNNTQAFDFECVACEAHYQLKSSQREVRNRIVDSAYVSMRRAIECDLAPNLLVLHYTDKWSVQSLLLIPSFCFTVNALEKRAPLSSTARRAGWVGCNILLNAIPADAKLKLVDKRQINRPSEVRSQFNLLKRLTALTPATRGWTLNTLRLARSLRKQSFSIGDMYQFERELSAIYPSNKHVRAKIRQQLQVLRDLEILRFVSRGVYEFTY